MDDRSRSSQRRWSNPTLAGLSEADKKLFGEIGERWNNDINAHRQIVLEVYSRLLPSNQMSGLSIRSNIAYGRHPRQVLDIFSPDGGDRMRPIVAFVHGGAFTRGSKSINGKIYDNVPAWFARQGAVGVNIEYRLAPEAKFPSGAHDVSAAVEWLARHAKEFGGDPDQIILIGHSAGGSHVASYACDSTLDLSPHPGLRSVVLVSARLRADIKDDNPNRENVMAYFGSDASRYDRISAISHAARIRIPVLIAVAEFENRYLDEYGREFFNRVSSEGSLVSRFYAARGHNHTSIVAHFGTEDEKFPREILSYLRVDCGINI